MSRGQAVGKRKVPDYRIIRRIQKEIAAMVSIMLTVDFDSPEDAEEQLDEISEDVLYGTGVFVAQLRVCRAGRQVFVAFKINPEDKERVLGQVAKWPRTEVTKCQ